MIKATLTNEILNYITAIDKNRYEVASVKLPKSIANKLRKNSKKKSSYASTKIEGNPLSEKQADDSLDDTHACQKESPVVHPFSALQQLLTKDQEV